MSRIVYDSEHGRSMCPRCRKRINRCSCLQEQRPEGDGIVRVRRELRRGKPMTVIMGLPMTAPELKDFGKTLKKKCGSGGSAKDGNIEIQGDHRDLLVPLLEGKGYTVKLAGG